MSEESRAGSKVSVGEEMFSIVNEVRLQNRPAGALSQMELECTKEGADFSVLVHPM